MKVYCGKCKFYHSWLGDCRAGLFADTPIKQERRRYNPLVVNRYNNCPDYSPNMNRRMDQKIMEVEVMDDYEMLLMISFVVGYFVGKHVEKYKKETGK